MPILIIFCTKHYLVLGHLRTKFELDNSKFAYSLDNLEQIIKKLKISKILKALMNFRKIPYQRSFMNILYLCAVLAE